MELCYIAGKVTGLKKADVLRNFEAAKEQVAAMGLVPVSPLDILDNIGKKWEDCMRNDLRALLRCTHVYMLNNWGDSRGAKLEFQIAVELGYKVHYQPK